MSERRHDERRQTLIQGGWVGWLPRKTQHLLGLVADMEDRDIPGRPRPDMPGVRVSTTGVDRLADVYESLGGPEGDAWEYDDPSEAETLEEADYDRLRRYDLIDRAERLTAAGYPHAHTNDELLDLLVALGLVHVDSSDQWHVTSPPPRPSQRVELTEDERALDERAIERSRYAPLAGKLRQLYMRVPLRSLELSAQDWAAAVGGSVGEFEGLVGHLLRVEGAVFSLAGDPAPGWVRAPETLVCIELDWSAWLRERRYVDHQVAEVLVAQGWVSPEELHDYQESWDAL